MRLIPYRRLETPARLWPQTGLYENLVRDFFTASPSFDREAGVPAVDVFEKDGNFMLRAELPGMDGKEIELKIEGSILTLSGERKFEEEEKKGSYHRIEHRYGTFSRSFSLPETADREQIKADYKNGVLTVTIPQKAEAKPREIPIRTQ